MPPTLQIRVFDPKTGTVTEQPIGADKSVCDVWLEPLPGASAIHIVLQVGKSARVRAEVEVDTPEPVPVRLAWNDERVLSLSSESRIVLMLPPDEDYAPAPPLQPARDSRDLDVLFLIDGTTRFVPDSSESLVPLLSEPQAWIQHVQKLLLFVTELKKRYAEVRTGVMAFGDHSMEFIASSADLKCGYVFYPENPEERKLRACTEEQLRQQFLSLEATGGGDFVDALADALLQSGYVGWRPKARRVLVLCGDSPGFSLLKPAPPGADIHVRHLDVDQEAMRLHVQHRVEIVTIYLGFRASLGKNPYGISEPRSLTDHARSQYRRLASLPNFFWDGPSFDPGEAANALNRVPSAIGRGPSYGILSGIDPVKS